MAKYVIDIDELECCEDCPCGDTANGCMDHGFLECNLSDKVPPVRYVAGEFSPYQFAHHDRPDWCPMMDLESEPSVMAMKEQIRALESKIHRQREAIAELTRRERWYDTVSTSKDQQILSLTRLVSELCDLVEWNRMSVDAMAPIAHEMEALGICTVSEFHTIALRDKSHM